MDETLRVANIVLILLVKSLMEADTIDWRKVILHPSTLRALVVGKFRVGAYNDSWLS